MGAMTRFVGDSKHMRLAGLIGALSLAAQSGCSGQEGGDTAPADPEQTRGIDSKDIRDTLPGAEPLRGLSFANGRATGHRVVRFNSLGRDFTLELVPNYELFAPDLVVERNGERL